MGRWSPGGQPGMPDRLFVNRWRIVLRVTTMVQPPVKRFWQPIAQGGTSSHELPDRDGAETGLRRQVDLSGVGRSRAAAAGVLGGPHQSGGN